MLGWGLPDDVATSVAHPLCARALAISSRGRRLVYLVADLCFVAASLRVGVLAELARRRVAVAPSDLMLTGTHTHAGPNGFSHAFFYDLSALGYSPRVHAALVRGCADAVQRAVDRLEPARLSLGEARVRGRVLVNRSLEAHRRDPEASAEGVDRTLLALRVDSAGGHPLGVLSLFALHCTSIHAGGGALHPDHKGLAAARMEREGPEGFVALFGQGAAGDVSPNVRFDPARGLAVGPGADDESSAALVATAQAEATRRAVARATPLSGQLDAAAIRVDLEERFVPPRFGGPARTTRSLLGLAMARGTGEGPGPLGRLRAPLRRPLAADPKLLMLRTGPGRGRRLLGWIDAARLPAGLHPAARHARRAARGGGLERAWIPTVLPVQILRIGALTLAGLPNEPTTVAGARLRRLLEARLGGRAHVQGYANAYSGYLTTPEEYALQAYEGAYTLFGPHTLGAFAAALDGLCGVLDGAPRQIEGPPLQTCTPAELAARAGARAG